MGIERAKQLVAGNYCLIRKPESAIARDEFGLSTLKIKRKLFGPALILNRSKLGKCLLLDLISGYTFERHLSLLAPYRIPRWSPDLKYLWSGIHNTNSNLFKHILEYNLNEIIRFNENFIENKEETMLNKGIDFLYISSAKPVSYLSHEKKGEITRDKKFQTSKTKAEENTTDNENQTSEIIKNSIETIPEEKEKSTNSTNTKGQTKDTDKLNPGNTERPKKGKPLIKIKETMESPEIRDKEKTEKKEMPTKETNNNPYKKLYKPRRRDILELDIKHRENERDKPLDRIILKELGAKIADHNQPMTIREITNYLTQIPPTKKLTRIEQEYTFKRLVESPSNQMEMDIQQALYSHPIGSEHMEDHVTNPHQEYESEDSDHELLGPELRRKEPTELRRKLSPLEFKGILKNKASIVHKGETIPHKKIQKQVQFVSTWLSPLDELKEQTLPELHTEPIVETTIHEESKNNLIGQVIDHIDQNKHSR